MAELTVFLQNGATYHFIDVENLNIDKNEETLEFDYYGQTVMKKRHAQFDTYKITGYAVDSQMVEDDDTDEKEEVKIPKYQEHIDVNQAIDDVLNFDTENGDKETAKIINDRLYTAIIQDYMEKYGSEIDEDKLGNHFVNLVCEKLLRDASEEKAKGQD